MPKILHPYYTLNWSLAEVWDFKAHPHMYPIVKYIEPKLIRGHNLPCWLWGGRMQYYNRGKSNEYAYPTIKIPVNIHDPREGLKSIFVHRFMAATFWEVADDEVVYRSCFKPDCVNPHHFRISHRNDPEFS